MGNFQPWDMYWLIELKLEILVDDEMMMIGVVNVIGDKFTHHNIG